MLKLLQNLWRSQTPELAYHVAVRLTQDNLIKQNQKYEAYLVERISKLEARLTEQPRVEKPVPAVRPPLSPAVEKARPVELKEVPSDISTVTGVEPALVMPCSPLEPPLITMVPTLPVLILENTAPVLVEETELEDDEPASYGYYSTLVTDGVIATTPPTGVEETEPEDDEPASYGYYFPLVTDVVMTTTPKREEEPTPSRGFLPSSEEVQARKQNDLVKSTLNRAYSFVAKPANKPTPAKAPAQSKISKLVTFVAAPSTEQPPNMPEETGRSAPLKLITLTPASDHRADEVSSAAED